MKKLLLTEPLQSILLGSMLGDGSLKKGVRGASFSEFHAQGQLAYVQWKMSYWGDCAGALTTVPAKKPTHQDALGFRTLQYAELLSWWELFYAHSSPSCDGKIRKKFPEAVAPLMTPLALAVWYMDDGMHEHWPSISCHERSHTVGLALLAQLGIQAVSEISSSSRLVVHGDDQARLFLRTVEPYVIPSLRYKLASSFLCRDREAVRNLIDLPQVQQRVDAGTTPKQIAHDLHVPVGFIHTALSLLGHTEGRQRTWPNADLQHLVVRTYTGKRPKLSLPKDTLQTLVDTIGGQKEHLPLIASRFGVYEGLVKRELIRHEIRHPQ